MCPGFRVFGVMMISVGVLHLVAAVNAPAQGLEPLGTNSVIEYDLQSKSVPFINLGWQPHYIRKGDGRSGWTVQEAQYQVIQDPNQWHTNSVGRAYLQFRVLAQMDNGEIFLSGVWNPSGKYGMWTDQERTVVSFSKNGGETWSELRQIPDAYDRPDMLVYLGGGRLTFQCAETSYFSNDYGRTWSDRIPTQRATNGENFSMEGNPLVERDAQGNVKRIAVIGFNFRGEAWHPARRTSAFIRWSYDGGRTWRAESEPVAWRWQETFDGEVFERGASEGSLARAKNGWLVAALRMDVPARYLKMRYSDSYEGLGVSISKDGGKTWSPIRQLYEAGRHHQKLLVMPNGDIVMTMTVRGDARDGELVSYRRGCDAIVSRDHGFTWETTRSYVLDEYQFYDGKYGFNGRCGHVNSLLLDDGAVLTGHNNYLTKGISLIRWRP